MSECSSAATNLTWRQLHWQRPLEAHRVVGLLRQWAADPRSPRLILEARSTKDGVAYLLGAPMSAVGKAAGVLEQMLPGTRLTPLEHQRDDVATARRLKPSTAHRALRRDDPEATARAVLGALAPVRGDEQLVLQIVLGPRRGPRAVPTNSSSAMVAPWWSLILNGSGGNLDGERRSALRTKLGEHGFACTVRLGVRAATPARRRSLVLDLLAAVRTSELAGIQLRLTRERSTRLDQASSPWLLWPLQLNVEELAGLTAWPLGDDDLPGLPALHPRPLPPTAGTTGTNRVVATATAPGVSATLALGPADALHHLHVIGPTGTGKSSLLGNLIVQDIEAGCGVVVIEPKGDLVEDILARVPDHRREDVVVLDPSDDQPVGLSPLAASGRRADVVADGLLSIFKELYGEAIGPRSSDILYSALLTLARRSDASLVMLPLLLTNPGFRRSMTSNLGDPIALEPFWALFESWSEAERSAAVAPVLNKIRPLLRPGLRAVLGQRQPRFDIRQVFTERKVLLVPLRQGVIGTEAASLLGSLVVAELWQATQERAVVAPAKRHPVMVYIDEVQNYLHLPTDLADGLAQARGLGVGFTLAHQFLGQFSPAMRSAVLVNARSRVAFQTAHADAAELAKGHPELTAADVTALGRHEVYASLYAGGQVTPYASGRTLAPVAPSSDPKITWHLSRERYGRPLDEVERGFADLVSFSAEADEGGADERQGRGRTTRRSS